MGQSYEREHAPGLHRSQQQEEPLLKGTLDNTALLQDCKAFWEGFTVQLHANTLDLNGARFVCIAAF